MYIMIQFINTIISFTSQNLPFSHRQNITQLTIFPPTLLSSSSEFLKFAGRSKKHPETQTHSAQCWNGCVFHSQPHWTWTLVPGWTTSQQCLSAGYIGESYIGWEEQLSRKQNWPCFKKCLFLIYGKRWIAFKKSLRMFPTAFICKLQTYFKRDFKRNWLTSG